MSLSRKALTKTSSLPSPHGSNSLLSDQEALTLHQIKGHDVRAFTASNAFYSGVSLGQILSACHCNIAHSQSSICRMWLGLIKSFFTWAQ